MLQGGRSRRLPVWRTFGSDLRRVERQARTTLAAERGEFLLELGAEALPSHLPHDELDSVPLRMLVVAVLVEHADDRLGGVQHLIDRQELVEHVAVDGENR